MVKSIIKILILMLLIATAGCGNSPELKPFASANATPAMNTSGTPTTNALTSSLPTPSSSSASVIGRLLQQGGQPLNAMVVFLEKTTPEHSVPDIIYAPPNDQPHVMTDGDGNFRISNVPDGEYVVIVFLPPATIHLVTELNGQDPRLITVKAGDQVNIGTIVIGE